VVALLGSRLAKTPAASPSADVGRLSILEAPRAE
jgi:hypothetical protein